jgi:excisionase family DNA binding protein
LRRYAYKKEQCKKVFLTTSQRFQNHMKDQTSYNPFENIDSRLASIEGTLSDLLGALAVRATPTNYYSVAEASKKLGVAEITVRRRVGAGEIPCKKVGSRIMIPSSYIDK